VIDIRLIPQPEFTRARGDGSPGQERLALLADMCRFNTLSAVKRAGSGHLGSSFSAMDLVVWLYFREMNTLTKGVDHPDRDVYFSSKGHDVPGLYAVLHAGGVVTREQLLKLRRLGGLDGHPDVGIRGIEANSGSLGMGISKGKGIAWAKRRLGRGGRVFVLTGDGELQEGQNY
jgi:transketolase